MADKYVFIPYTMSSEQTKEALVEQLERLRKENEQLRKELLYLRQEKGNDNSVSFKEKYAVKILDSLPDMLTVFNHKEVGIEVVSNEETNHVGVTNKDFVGMHMCDMVPPEAYQNIHSNMRHAITTRTVSAAHHELDFNGKHHYYENRIFPLDEEYVLIMCRDITEGVSTQRQLEVFKSVLDKVSDSILAVAEDGTLVYANKQFIEEYGVTQELGTQKIYELPVSMKTKEAWEKRLQEVRDNDGSFAYRAAYVRKGENKKRIHQVSTFLIRENDQELTWFFTQDITDVIKKRDELRELNLLLDGILNNIPVYLFVKDPEDEFRYLYWNKAFADHSGIPASKAIGHTDFEIFPSHEDAEKFHKDDLELLRTHKRGVTSELGKGSTFYFTIPCEEVGERGKLFKVTRPESNNNPVNPSQQVKRILVAEDVESNFILLKNLIGKNYTLLWAKDGFEAVEIYKQYHPDLILMDIKMPRMNGLEATHIIRTYSKKIPIIALTAYAFEADKELALEAGCDDFVTKPLSEKILKKALDKYSATI